jgi:hypothetical protein
MPVGMIWYPWSAVPVLLASEHPTCASPIAGGVLDGWHMRYDMAVLLLCHQVECVTDACAAVSQWQPADSNR